MGKCLFMRKGETHSAPNGLPSGYTKLSYIAFSGTQYIDTEYSNAKGFRTVVDFELTSIDDVFKTVVGSHNTSAPYSRNLVGIQSGKFFVGVDEPYAVSTAVASGVRYNVDFSSIYPNVYCNINGVNAWSKSLSSPSLSTLNVLIGADQYSLANGGSLPSMKLYACQIYDNGTLVRDFIPCLNADGVAGLYDTLNKKFYGNKGTGVFLYPTNDGILAGTIAVGSTVKLNENGIPVEYLVVNQGIPSNSSLYDSSCNGTWLLRKDLESKQVWNSSANNDYMYSTIHPYLNGDFFNSFDMSVQNIIAEVKIPYGIRGGSGAASGSNGISTKVFLLSCRELGWTNVMDDGAKLDYFLLGNDWGQENCNKRIAYLNGTADSWWTRSITKNNLQQVKGVASMGALAECNSNAEEWGVRPALVLPFDAKFDPNTLVLKGVA